LDAPLSPAGRLDFRALETAFQQAHASANLAAQAGSPSDFPAEVSAGPSSAEGRFSGIYLLCNPHNPLGTVHTRPELEQLAQLAAQYRIFVLADEIHHALARPGIQFTPYLSLPQVQNAVTAVSGSKSYNLACLKAAAAIPAPDSVSAEIVQAAARQAGGASLLAVQAQIFGFQQLDDYLKKVNSELQLNQELLLDLLSQKFPDASFVPAQASFLQWVNFDAYAESFQKRGYSSAAEYFLQECQVAFNPGAPFGGPQFRHSVRINFATNPAILRQVVAQLKL
jgi:cystathionine beta-lyase